MIVVPAGFIETYGLERAQTMARQITDVIEGWTTTPPSELTPEQSSRFSHLLDILTRGSESPNVGASTLGELMSDNRFQPPTNPETPLPENLRLVIYLDPNRNNAGAGTHIYRGREVLGRGRSGLPIVDIGTQYFDEFLRYGQESLAGNLALAGEVAEGTAVAEGSFFAAQVENAIAFNQGRPLAPSTDPSDTSFTLTDSVDRAGLEMEVSAVTLSRDDGVTLFRTQELARTSANELGIPVFKLTADVLREGGPRYPELIIAPLESGEHMGPELNTARQILLNQLRNTNNTNLTELIFNYNAELIDTLGEAGFRYYLNTTYAEGEQLNLTRRAGLPIRYANQSTLLIPYDHLGSDAFINSLPRTLNPTEVRALRTRSGEFLTALGITEPSREMTAFAFHLFFNAYQRRVAGGNSAVKVNFGVLSRYSLEDVIYSVLSDSEVQLVQDWYRATGNRERLLTLFSSENLADAEDLSVGAWLDNILDTTAELRLETGRSQLEVSSSAQYYSPVPDASQRLVQHLSHPNPESRRAFVLRDGRYYGAVEYRDVTNLTNRLASSPNEWLNGDRATLVRSLLADVPDVDPYSAKAAALLQQVDTLLARWRSRAPADEAAARLAVDQLLTRVGALTPTRDSAGRLSQSHESWWRQVHRVGATLENRLRTAGVNLESEWGRGLRSTFDSRWGVDLAAPPNALEGIRFENNQFHTWRGVVTGQELGLAQGWRPGSDIDGFTVIRGEDGTFTYVPDEAGNNAIGRQFTLAWNGRAWPSRQLLTLSTLRYVSNESVTFTDSQGNTHTIDIPIGSERLDGTHRIWAFSQEEGDVGLVINLEDYAANPQDLARDWASFREHHVLLSETEAGRAILSNLQLNAADLGRYAPGTDVNGLLAEWFNGEDALAYVVRLAPDASGWGRVAPTSGTGRLAVLGMPPLGQGQGLEADAVNYFRRAYELRNEINLPEAGPLTDAQYLEARRVLTGEHAYAREVGLPLRAVIDPSRVENFVTLDGFTPLVDEDYNAISPRQVYYRNLRNAQIFMARDEAFRLGVDTSDIIVNPESPLEGIENIIDRVEARAPVDNPGRTSGLEGLNNLRRAIGETVYVLEGRTDLNVFDPALGAVGDEFPGTDPANVQAYVNDENLAWRGRSGVLSSAREAGALVNSLVTQELDRFQVGTRNLEDISFWLDTAREDVRDSVLSNLLERYLVEPEHEGLLGILTEYQTEIANAWERGTLSGLGRHALGLRLNQLRQHNLATPGVLPTTELTLDAARTRFLLELLSSRARDVGIRTAQGEVSYVRRPRSEAVTTTLGEGIAERRGLAQLVNQWRLSTVDGPVSWRGLETALTRGVALENGVAPRTLLTRIYNRETGALEGIGYAVERIAANDFEIRAVAWDPATVVDGDFSIGRDILVENVRAIHALSPEVNIRITPGHQGLLAQARGVFFTQNTDLDFFSNERLLVDFEQANAGVQRLQRRSVDVAITQLEGLAQSLRGRSYSAVQDAVVEFRQEWNEFRSLTSFEGGIRERSEVYFRLRQQLGDLADQVVRRAEAGGAEFSTDQLNFLRRLSETAPQGATQEGRSVLVVDNTPLVVVQLEEDPVVGETSRFLAEKSSGPVSRYRLVSGELVHESGPVAAPTAESKIFLVGHGTPDRVSGLTASEIIGTLVNQGLLVSGDEIRRISVVACSTDNPNTPVEEGAPRSRFAETLIREAEDLGVTVRSVTARTELVTVDSSGRKWTGTPDAEGRVEWTRDGGGSKLLVERLSDGSLGTSRVNVDQGLVENRWGTTTEALGFMNRTQRFVNGEQVDENGLGIEPGQGLSEAELAVVRTLLGENPTGTVEVENGNIRVLSTESVLSSGINEQDALGRAQELIANLSDGTATAQETAQQFLYLSESEQAAAGNELLRAYGEHPESTQLRAGVRVMNPMLRELLDAGSLNDHSRFVIEVALEQFRIQRNVELRGVTGSVDYSIILAPYRAQLALETAQTRAPALRRVTVDENGISRTTVTNPEGAAYTNEVYSLGSFQGEDVVPPPRISTTLLRNVTQIMEGWIDIARGQGDAGFYGVYESVRDALRDGGVRPGEGESIRPTSVVITRAPDGNVVAVGLHSLDDGVIWNDYTVTDARLRVQPRPAGEYWLGAGYENIIATLRETTTRYPGLSQRSIAVNAQTHITDVNLYYNEGRWGQAVPRVAVDSWAGAARSLMQRKITLLTTAIGELETASRVHLTAAESARLTQLRTQLSELNTRVAEATTVEDFVGLDLSLDRARVDTAGTSQAIRGAHPQDVTLQRLGSNVRFVDTAFRPTSDGLHVEYTRLIRTLTAQGLTLSSEISEAAGTPEDFARLFELVGVEGTAAQGEIIEGLRPGNGNSRVPETTLNRFQQEVSTALGQKASTLSTLLETYAESPSSALAELLGTDTAWILKFYREGRLSTQARLLVETQLERVRATDIPTEGIRRAFQGNLFADPARAQLALNRNPSETVQYLEFSEGRSTPRIERGGYRNQAYVLIPDSATATQGRTALTGTERAAVLDLLNRWSNEAGRLGLGSDVSGRYTRVITAINDAAAGRITGGRENIMVTRNPQGEIVAVNLYTQDEASRTITIEAVVENSSRYRLSSVTEGRVYINGDRDGIRAVMREAQIRYPDHRIRIAPVDTGMEEFLRQNFFSDSEQARLFSSERGTALGTYAEAQRTLIESQLRVLSQGVYELGEYSRLNPAILEGHWQTKLDTLSQRIRTFTAELDDAEGSEIRVLGEEFYEMRRRFANISDFSRLNSVDQATFEQAFSVDSLELVRQHNQLPSDATEVFQRLVGVLPETYEFRSFFESARGTPTEFIQLLSQLGAILEPEEFAARLEPVFRDAAADRISPEVRDYFADALVLASSNDIQSVGEAVGSIEDFNVVQDFIRSVDSGLAVDLGQGHLPYWGGYWEQNYGPIEEVDSETLRQSTPDGEIVEGNLSPRERASAIRFNSGVQVDEFGLPLLPTSEEALSTADLTRVTTELGSDFTGKVRVTPTEVVEVITPDVLDLNPELAEQQGPEWEEFRERFEHLRRDGVDAAEPFEAPREGVPEAPEELRFADRNTREAIVPGEVVQEHHIFRANPETPLPELAGTEGDPKLETELVSLEQESTRLLEVRNSAIETRISQYGRQTGLPVVLDPGSPITRTGNRVRFSVVLRRDVDPSGNVRDGARRMSLETEEIPGFSEDNEAATRRLSALVAADDGTSSRAWAGFLGGRRRQEALAFTPESGTQPATPVESAPRSLMRALESVEGRALVAAAIEATETLIRTNNLATSATAEWVPVLATMEERAGGTYRVQFMNRLNPEQVQWVETTDDTLFRLRGFMEEQLQVERTALEQRRQGFGADADAPDGLNAAFLVQFVVNLAQEFQRQGVSQGASGTLHTALEVHRWLFGAQVLFGAATDTVKLVRLARTLLSSSEALTGASRAGHALAYAGEAIGVGFMTANVILDSIQIANASNAAQRAVFGTQLAFDVTGLVLSSTALGLSITAGVAGYVAGHAAVAATAAAAGTVAAGAATAGAIIGGAGVIVAGLGIGAAALAQNYSIIADEAKAIGKYFKAIYDGYEGNGFELINSNGTNVLSARGGVVITDVDFRTSTLEFGTHYMNQTTHGSTGSGRQNYFFWVNDGPVENTSATIDIGQALGVADSPYTLLRPQTEVVVLPATPETHLSGYKYQTLPGAVTRNDPGFGVLRALEEDETFDFDYYLFPSEYILHRIENFDYRNVNTDIYLNGNDRTLLMPDLPTEHNNKIGYTFHGQGGQYVIGLNDGYRLISLGNDGNTASTWIFDTANLDAQNVTFRADLNQLHIGGARLWLSSSVRRNNNLLLVNHQKDLYTIDWATRTTSLVSIDGQGHGDHASLLTYLNFVRDRVPGRFITVNNYDNADGTRIGTVWYDKTDRVIRYVDVNDPRMTQRLNLIDFYEGKLYLTAVVQQKVELWVVNAADGRIENRYGMADVPTNGSQRLSGVWHNGQQLIFEQIANNSMGETITRRYRLDNEGLKLVSINGDESLVTSYRSYTPGSRWFNDVLSTSPGHILWTQNPGTTAVSTGTYQHAVADDWVLVAGADSRVWLSNGSVTERVIPDMSEIPDDLHFFGRDSSQTIDVFLFYSQNLKRLYRQEGNPIVWNWQDADLEKIVNGNFNQARGWIFVGDAARVAETGQGEYQVGINDGSIYQAFDDLHFGTHYALSLEVGGGTAATGTGVLKVYWNNNEVASIDWATGMETHEVMVVADTHNSLRIEVEPDDGATNPPRFFVDDVSLLLSPITEYDGVEHLLTLGANPIFSTLHGHIRQLETSGDTQLIGVNQTWLSEHPNRTAVVQPDPEVLERHTSDADERPENLPDTTPVTEMLNWRIDLRRLARNEGVHAEAVLTINGITTSTGTDVPAWYDTGSDRFVIAPAVTTGSLLFLGLTTDETQALLYNPGTDQIFVTSVLNETALASMFGNDHVLEASAVIPGLTDIFAGAGITVDQVVPHDGNQYLATTTQGLAFLVGHNSTPSLAAVLDTWTGTQAELEALFTTWRHEDVVRVFRRGVNGREIQNWWLSDNRKWAALSGRERDEMEFLGESADRTLVYLLDKTAGEILELRQTTGPALTNAPAGRVIDTVSTAQRYVGETDSLYLVAADVEGAVTTREVVLPVLHGIDSLVLSGGNGSDQFRISAGAWAHYDVIVIDSRDGSSAMDTVHFDANIDPGHMVVSRDDDGGLVIWDSRNGKRLILRGVVSDDAAVRALHQNIQVQFANLAPLSIASLAQSVQGSTTPDTIRSHDQDDAVRGGLGRDVISTGDGNDVIYGEAGDDTINAGGDDDIIVGGRGADSITGGTGEDTLVFIGDPSNSTGVVVNLALGTGSGGDAQGDTYREVEHVNGSNYADVITGNDQSNRLSGQVGNDTLDGRGGNDLLAGGLGNDILIGGDGADTYVVNQGEGNVTIRNRQAGDETNVLRLDVDRANLTLTRSGNHLLIALSGTPASQVTVEDWFSDANVRHLQLLTRDHYLLTPDTVTVPAEGSEVGQDGGSPALNVGFSIEALDYSNATQRQIINVPEGQEIHRVTGSRFRDNIVGNSLDNIIVSNGGSDTLVGLGGSDTYVIGADSGVVTVNAGTLDGQRDTIVLAMDASAYTGSRMDGSALLFETSEGTTVRILSFAFLHRTGYAPVISMQGKNYTLDGEGRRHLVSIDLSHETSGQTLVLPAGAFSMGGSDFTDHLTGNDQNNLLDGGNGGQDTLVGLNGVDTYSVELETATLGIVPSAVIPDFESAGGRLITIDNRATDGGTDVIRVENADLTELQTRRVGDDLFIYRGQLDLSGTARAFPDQGIRVTAWFSDPSVRHLTLVDQQGSGVSINDSGSFSALISLNDAGHTENQTRNLTDAAFSHVIKVTDGAGDDTYTGNDNDNLFVLSSGGNDTVTGGNGRDTYHVTLDGSGRQTFNITNNGTDGEKDHIILDISTYDLFSSGIGFSDPRVQISFRGGRIFLEAPQTGQDELPYLVTTQEGYTYRVLSSGEMRLDSVDISGTGTTELDLTAPLALPPVYLEGEGDGGLIFLPFFGIPSDYRRATTLRGGVTTSLLAGDGDGETLMVNQTRSEGVTLRGRGGSDIYVTGSTGTYFIDNTDASRSEDLLFLDHRFQDLILSRFNDDLIVESYNGNFHLEVTNYLSSAANGDDYRHLEFITQDKVRFILPSNLPNQGNSTKLRPTIIGLDFSDETAARTIDLRDGNAFGHALMAVGSFTGSATAATRVTSGDTSIELSTGDAKDIITTGAGNDTIHAYGGDDVVIAGSGRDTLYGGAGNDHLDGGRGNDFFISGQGADWLYGGEGSDTVVYFGNDARSAGVTVNLDTGKGQGSDADGDTYVSIENVRGSQYADIITGNDGANILNGRGGADRLYGLEGDDVLVANDGVAVHLDGGAGTDIVDFSNFTAGISVDLVSGSASHRAGTGTSLANPIVDRLIDIENIVATDHDDLIIGDTHDNTVIAGLGRDLYLLGQGHDVVDYRNLILSRSDNNGVWVDLIHRELIRVEAGDGVTSNFLVHGLSQVEEVWGSTYNDRLYGSHSNDVLAGYFGKDIIRAKGGDDLIYAWADGDKIFGGLGTDTVDYGFTGEGVTVDLGRGGANGLDSLNSIENVTGSLFNDILVGSDAANILEGSLGLDVIRAMGGDDTIRGLGDGDRIDGGTGSDTVTYADADAGVFVSTGAAPLDVDQVRHWENLAVRPDYLSNVENIIGSSHADRFETGDGVDVIRSGAGDDYIRGSLGNDEIFGGEGMDTVSYRGMDQNFVVLLAFNLTLPLTGASFVDRLQGVERVEGGSGNDIILGPYTGSSYIYASEGQDQVIVQSDVTVDFSRILTDNGIRLDAQGDLGTTYTATFDVDDSSSRTSISSLARIEGSLDDDVLNGGAGNDTFDGNSGNDTLRGGMGIDVLDGGAGDDVFRFVRGDQVATIRDSEGNDTLRLERYSATEINFFSDGDDLIITAGRDALRIEDQLASGGPVVEQVVLSNDRQFTARDMADSATSYASRPSGTPDIALLTQAIAAFGSIRVSEQGALAGNANELRPPTPSSGIIAPPT